MSARSEEQVLEAIEARRRRPHVKLMDEHVTLSHGAGGKSSHVLTEMVFLRALRTRRCGRSATRPRSPGTS